MIAVAGRALILRPSFARAWYIAGILRIWAGQLGVKYGNSTLAALPGDHLAHARAGLQVLGHAARRALTVEFPPRAGTLTSNIVRLILAGVPVRVVAVHHDTSVAMIERTYSRFIGDHADALARVALLDTANAAEGTLVPLHGRG